MKILFVLLSITFSSHVFAKDSVFPKDYKSWKKVATPLNSIGALPGCDADVSKLPPIYQQTVKTYCGVKPGGPGKASVYVKKDAVSEYESNKKEKKFKDGTNMVLHLEELKVLFVTYHKAGKPNYKVYTEGGKDITKSDGGPLSASTCVTCHTGYQAFCKNGQCGQVKSK